MTVQQVADYMQMSTNKVYDMPQKGDIPALKICQQWRFDRAEIDAWPKSCSVNVKASRRPRKERGS